MAKINLNYNSVGFINQHEQKSFLRTAIKWHGSVTPVVMPRVLCVVIYAAIFEMIQKYFSFSALPVTPFEYTGFALGVLLVFRMNAGLDRWWEARKIWGQIVNQSRNLAIIGYSYTPDKSAAKEKLLNYVACWPYVMMASLQHQPLPTQVKELLSENDFLKLEKIDHKPSFIAEKIIQILKKLREQGLDDFAFHIAEQQRSELIDAIGACERIASTPIPLVLAIKIRRFLLMFLILLPFTLIDKSGLFTFFIMALVSYPLFGLDEIGVQLQNPFQKNSLSRLPIEGICDKIRENVLCIKNY